jgi:AbrB family looped-hinge helix DNA binding protein
MEKLEQTAKAEYERRLSASGISIIEFYNHPLFQEPGLYLCPFYANPSFAALISKKGIRKIQAYLNNKYSGKRKNDALRRFNGRVTPASVDSKQRLEIPKSIREELNLSFGDNVRIEVYQNYLRLYRSNQP